MCTPRDKEKSKMEHCKLYKKSIIISDTACRPGVAGDGFSVTELEGELSLWLVEDRVSV